MKKKSVQIVALTLIMIICTALFSNYSFAATQMSEQQKTAFNKQFTIYEGQQTGSVVKAIINSVSTNNSNNASTQVKINVKASDIDNSSKYTVKCNYSNGLVNEIVVTKVSGASKSTTSSTTSSTTTSTLGGSTSNLGSKSSNTNLSTYKSSKNTATKDNSVTTSKTLPKTGEAYYLTIAVLVVLAIAIKLALNLKKYDDIK